jgi:hypothetical protein
MSVDLRKLIATRSYMVAIRASEICDKLLAELKTSGFWQLKSKRPKSAIFSLDYKENYAKLSCAYDGKAITETNMALKRVEYDSDPFKCYQFVQKQILNWVPTELAYIILEESVIGCIVQATCKPMLYFKLVREIDHEESDPQNVRIENEAFLDDVFIGGLGAKEIQEKAEVNRLELLINDVNNRQITERIYEMLRDATTCVLLMGWVGTDCLPKLKELKSMGVTVRSITHKPNEFKSPVPADIQKGYPELIGIIGLDNVSINPLLHGRACIVDNKALIGSMDFNSHSLSGEHIEFAIYTEDADTVRSLRSYFESMFKPLKEAEK